MTLATNQLLHAAIERASSECDEDAYWSALDALKEAPMHEVWELLVPLASNDSPRLRCLVPDVLRSVPTHAPALLEPTMSLLVSRLSVEQSPTVIASILHAFAELEHPDRVEPALALSQHPDADVRYGAVHALLGA